MGGWWTEALRRGRKPLIVSAAREHLIAGGECGSRGDSPLCFEVRQLRLERGGWAGMDEVPAGWGQGWAAPILVNVF